MKAMLFGAAANDLSEEVERHPELELVTSQPEVVICYGGDGTLLSAELEWPGVPKVPIKNSRRGIRCISRPPRAVIERLAQGRLVRTEYMKLECALQHHDHPEPLCLLTAMNEFNVHMGNVNSAVRFRMWINDDPYNNGQETIGDGFVISTPFGSTAYFNHLTRGVFYTGMGIAMKAPAEQTTHVIVPETSVVRVRITRGPAVLAFDNSPEYFDLEEGDVMTVRRHGRPAVVMTWQAMTHPSDRF